MSEPSSSPFGQSQSQRQESAGLTDAGETRLVKGEKDVEALMYSFVNRATSSYMRAVSDRRIPRDISAAIEFTRSLMQKHPGFKLQLIVDLQNENLEYYRALMELGADVRHIGGNKVIFAISKEEYLSVPIAAIEEQIVTGAPLPREIIWSTRKDVVSQFEQIFKLMWNSALRASLRIKELEEGKEPELTIVVQDMRQAFEIGKRMSEECRQEALMILASDKTILRNEALFRKLSQRQQELGFDIRVLSPVLEDSMTSVLPGAQWRKLEEPIKVSIMIYDRRRMFITQYSDVEASTTEEAVSVNIYSTSRLTISGMASVFEALWRETELRELEERNRKRAELLQDVLTHDIRNYNQVSKMGVELVAENLKSNPQLAEILASVVEAIDGSTQLVEKARKLGRIIASQDGSGPPQLQGVDLIQSIERSLLLVKKTYPAKQIRETRKVFMGPSPSGVEEEEEKKSAPETIRVVADDLIDDVFVNLFSNSAKFTPGEDVLIEITIQPKSVLETDYWEITIRDSGPGIPPEQREGIFERYSKGSKGSGLGLSIVHALVVGRYGGMISIKDGPQRNAAPSQTSDREGKKFESRGATFIILLKKASDSNVVAYDPLRY